MIIQGIGEGIAIEVFVPIGHRAARIAVEADGEMAVISIDSNHLEALEMACKAARLELDARAVGP